MPRDKTGQFYYSWFPTIYMGDTQKLSLAEDGAYRRLIDHYMLTRAPLLDDDRALSRIIGVGAEEWQVVKNNVKSYFKPSENPSGYLHHEFCDQELKIHHNRMVIAKENGVKGGRPKYKKNINKKPSENPSGSEIKPIGQAKHNIIEEVSKKDSDSKELSGDLFQTPPVDFKRVIFTEGLKLVGGEKSRSLVGKWVSKHGEAAVCAAMLEAQKQKVIDPKTYIIKLLEDPTEGKKYSGINRNPG